MEEQKIKLAFQGMTKTKPTKEDKKKQKISEIEKRIKGYERKIKLNQTLLKKANKKLKRLGRNSPSFFKKISQNGLI